jgi:hypothetical protein
MFPHCCPTGTVTLSNCRGRGILVGVASDICCGQTLKNRVDVSEVIIISLNENDILL